MEYEKEDDPPGPSPKRCMEVGAATVRALKDSPCGFLGTVSQVSSLANASNTIAEWAGYLACPFHFATVLGDIWTASPIVAIDQPFA